MQPGPWHGHQARQTLAGHLGKAPSHRAPPLPCPASSTFLDVPCPVHPQALCTRHSDVLECCPHPLGQGHPSHHYALSSQHSAWLEVQLLGCD